MPEDILYAKKSTEYNSKIKRLENLSGSKAFYAKGSFKDSNQKGRFTELTENEKQLSQKMELYRETFIKDSKESTKASYGKYPSAQPFYEVKETISKQESKDKLLEIFQAMPKGGLLHVHSSAALSFDEYKKLLIYWHQNHKPNPVDVSTPLEDNTPYSLYVLWPGGEIPTEINKYNKGTLFFAQTIKKMQEPIKNKLAENCKSISVLIDSGSDLNAEFQKLLYFNEESKSAYIWDALNSMFSMTSSLLECKEFYIEYHKRFLKECIDDNIQYVELRSGFATFFPETSNIDAYERYTPTLAMPTYHWQNHFYHAEINAQKGLQPGDFLTVLQTIINGDDIRDKIDLRVILNARRDIVIADKDILIDKINSAIYFKQKAEFKDLIIGFDFVSEEDRGRPTKEYIDLIYGPASILVPNDYWTDMLGSVLGNPGAPRIELIDFYLHDGESLWHDNDNCIHAVLTSRYRIGHGFNMINYPGLVNAVTQIPSERSTTAGMSAGEEEYTVFTETNNVRTPMLEICPISNQLLQYYPDLRAHPAASLMASGVQCVIGNDDPQMFGNPGLSYDFWMAYMSFGLNLQGIKRLVYNSYSAKYGHDISRICENFHVAWNHFVDQNKDSIETEPSEQNPVVEPQSQSEPVKESDLADKREPEIKWRIRKRIIEA